MHGGTTERDIAEFVYRAEKEVLLNRKHSVHTVAFFDEANTTDAIGLIKEVICDRRLHGRPVSDDLKFIAACNPYRRFDNVLLGYSFCMTMVLPHVYVCVFSAVISFIVLTVQSH